MQCCHRGTRVGDGKNKDIMYFHWENRCHGRQDQLHREHIMCCAQRMTEGCLLVTEQEERRIFLLEESSVWKGLVLWRNASWILFGTFSRLCSWRFWLSNIFLFIILVFSSLSVCVCVLCAQSLFVKHLWEKPLSTFLHNVAHLSFDFYSPDTTLSKPLFWHSSWTFVIAT